MKLLIIQLLVGEDSDFMRKGKRLREIVRFVVLEIDTENGIDASFKV